MSTSTSSSFNKIGRIISGTFFALIAASILLFLADSLLRNLA
ncbi:hypothetical protein [uncultured Endozoicomonas sp.]|nr:hypothetical protein [uncultured Endozoicomonas sp.]